MTQSFSQTSLKKISRSQLVLIALTLFALWFVLCRQLSGEWSVNQQYSYGWFVPFFAAFLFWLRWEERGELRIADCGLRKGTNQKQRALAIGAGVLALLVLLPVRLFEIANPDWRPLDWIHAFAVIAITFAMLYLAGGWAWVKHFSFPVLFFLIAVPWITPIEEPIVQGLMRGVAAAASETITLFGIPAQLEGNLIRVNTGLVGVNEACSGVRSLQTSLMIGLLFGELKRLSFAKRCFLVLGALAIAVIANFGRAFFLVWMAATRDISAVDRWHDLAGYTIVGVVFVGSLGLAALLGRRRRPKVESRMEPAGAERHGQRPTGERAGARESKSKVESTEADKELINPNAKDEIAHTEKALRPLPLSTFAFRLSTFPLLFSLLWLLAVEIGVEAWYRMHERGLVARERWTARWPGTAKDFRDIHIDETTRRILRFDEGRGGMWKIAGSERSEGERRKAKGESGAEDAALLYFFRWRAGSNSALLANLHRPDVCLPASGWVQAGDYGIRSYAVSSTLSLPFRHFLFSQGTPGPGTGGRQRFAHAFYCLREDRVRNESDASPAREEFAQQPSEWSRSERMSLVVQGRRHLGQQVMEFVMIAAQSVKPEEAEATFAQAAPELIEGESRK